MTPPTKIQTSLQGDVITYNHCPNWRFLAWMTTHGVVVVDTLTGGTKEQSFVPEQGNTTENILLVSHSGKTASLAGSRNQWRYKKHPEGEGTIYGTDFGVSLGEETGLRYVSHGQILHLNERPNPRDAILYGRELVRHLRFQRTSHCLPLYNLRGEVQIPGGMEHIDKIDVHLFGLAKVIRNPLLEDKKNYPEAFAYQVISGSRPGWSWSKDWERRGYWTRLGGRLIKGRPFMVKDPLRGLGFRWREDSLLPQENVQDMCPMEDACGYLWVVEQTLPGLRIFRLDRLSEFRLDRLSE